jgi:uncharacterized membrane protein YvlD (DUF360 family)
MKKPPIPKKLSAKLTFKQTIMQLVISSVSLLVAVELFNEIKLSSYIIVIPAVLVIQLLLWIAGPIFEIFIKYFGIGAILIVSLFGNALVVWVAFQILPDISNTGFWNSFVTAWIYALITTVINWILVSQSDDVFLSEVIRHSNNKNAKYSDKAGFIFVQLDGVSGPVLEWQLKAGNLPNISKLLKDDYTFRKWHTGLPATTPASQAGILLGSNDNIPAFRWYEKDKSKLIVANQFEGAHLIEERLSNGNGLLVDGGVSVGNLFSGDAEKNIMVMSKLHSNKDSIRKLGEYKSYFATSFGFMRSFILSIGEMAKEIYQARRQVSRDMQPRINRHGSYILLRAATNVVLRDLQTTIVIQNMLKGVNSLYVDYLDYDEVAHHAGLARAESFASLSGLDRVVGILTRAKEFAPRSYNIVFLSDHGQSQGTTFKQLHNGKTLEDYVQQFLGSNIEIQSSTEPVEQQHTEKSLINKKNTRQKQSKTKPDIVITGSGNLGNIWINEFKKRASYEQIVRKFPDFIDNIVDLKGVGFVILMSESGPICISSKGKIYMKTKKVTGENPVSRYSSVDQQAIERLCNMDNAPDVAVISSHDPDTDEVHAFEELVGNHGGLGGWQTEAILLHPKNLIIPNKFTENGQINGAENIHKIFKSWISNGKIK